MFNVVVVPVLVVQSDGSVHRRTEPQDSLQVHVLGVWFFGLKENNFSYNAFFGNFSSSNAKKINDLSFSII